MSAYFVILALCVIIAVQSVIYRRERLKLYDLLMAEKEKTVYSSRDKPQYDYKTRRNRTAHKKALEKWRNGGEREE